MFASTENVLVHRYEEKVLVAWQRECLDVHFEKKLLWPIPYGLCTYEHEFEGISGNTVLFYTGTYFQRSFFWDKVYFASSKILKFITILISTSKVTC